MHTSETEYRTCGTTKSEKDNTLKQKPKMTVNIFLKGQDVVRVGQFAFLCSRQGLSAPQRSVAVGVLQWRVVLSVAQPGEGQTQQRAHQYVYRKED